jgi:hypothetical protein
MTRINFRRPKTSLLGQMGRTDFARLNGIFHVLMALAAFVGLLFS